MAIRADADDSKPHNAQSKGLHGLTIIKHYAANPTTSYEPVLLVSEETRTCKYCGLHLSPGRNFGQFILRSRRSYECLLVEASISLPRGLSLFRATLGALPLGIPAMAPPDEEHGNCIQRSRRQRVMPGPPAYILARENTGLKGQLGIEPKLGMLNRVGVPR